MIEREPVRDSAAAVMPADEELLEAEAAHQRQHVERHRALAVRGVIGRPFGLVGLAVAAQVRDHEHERAAPPLGDLVPRRVRLRKAVQQQQRRPLRQRCRVVAGVEVQCRSYRRAVTPKAAREELDPARGSAP
jgi:hypothetical protein